MTRPQFTDAELQQIEMLAITELEDAPEDAMLAVTTEQYASAVDMMKSLALSKSIRDKITEWKTERDAPVVEQVISEL